jgi:hypothetical protein
VGIIARLVRTINSQRDNHGHKATGRWPDRHDRNCGGAAPWLRWRQTVQPSLCTERRILWLAPRPGETGCPAACISPGWLWSIRSVATPGHAQPAPSDRRSAGGISVIPKVAIPVALDSSGVSSALRHSDLTLENDVNASHRAHTARRRSA